MMHVNMYNLMCAAVSVISIFTLVSPYFDFQLLKEIIVLSNFTKFGYAAAPGIISDKLQTY